MTPGCSFATTRGACRWLNGLRLQTPVAYGACVNTPWGIACLGGSDGENVLADCFLLQWDPGAKTLAQTPLPPLPKPCVHGAAARIGNTIYLAGGQSDLKLDSAMANFWRLDLSALEAMPDVPAAQKAGAGAPVGLRWEQLPVWPGPGRAFNLAVAQHDGFDDCIYVISGRRQVDEPKGTVKIDCLTDIYEFNPKSYTQQPSQSKEEPDSTTSFWRRRAELPSSVMAGTGAAVGQSHIFVLSGADGSLIGKEDELRDRHPGFPKRGWAYHTIADTWIDTGAIPANQVTTPATRWNGAIVPCLRRSAASGADPVGVGDRAGEHVAFVWPNQLHRSGPLLAGHGSCGRLLFTPHERHR